MMNSKCKIPNCYIIQQRQELSQVEDDSSHVKLHNHQNHSHVVSMSEDRMRELIWEKGQPTESGFGGMSSHCRRGIHGGFNNNNTRDNSGVDTLEDIVNQATKNGHHYHQHQHESIMGSYNGGELVENDPVGGSLLMKKRLKSSEKYPTCSIGNTNLECGTSEDVAKAVTSDTTTTIIMESVRSGKTTYEDSAACHTASEKQDSENERKEEAVRSHQTRTSRAADTHKQSERKRRDRINQKMKALQKLVPNACKTDKASMLDEVIEYMKQLKAQINLMGRSRSVHDEMLMMMMPSIGMQQQLQMASLMARIALHHQSFLPGILTSQAVAPPVAPPPIIETPTIQNNDQFHYGRFLPQPMNMELYNNMRAFYTQQATERSQQASNDQANYVHRQL